MCELYKFTNGPFSQLTSSTIFAMWNLQMLNANDQGSKNLALEYSAAAIERQTFTETR